jgi:thiol-disulfide isomerase/thioredoxin
MTRLAASFIMLALCSFGPTLYLRSLPVSPNPVNDADLLALGETAPEWKLSDAEGQAHSLSDYPGKVIVLDFWATWCGPCAEIMRQMQKLHEKYRDRGVAVFGVNSWDKQDPIPLMKERHCTYRLLFKGEEISKQYKISSLPTVYIIGVDGRIIYRHQGAGNKNLDKLLEKYLTEHGM